jgi:hypothetical protein
VDERVSSETPKVRAVFGLTRRNAGAIVGLAIVGWVGELRHVIRPEEFPQSMAVLVGGAGLLYGGRIPVHLSGGYWSWRPWRTKWPARAWQLNALIVASAGLVSVWIGSAIFIWIEPRVVVQCLVSFYLYVAAVVVSGAVVNAARDLGLERGSEIVKRWRWIVFLRASLSPAKRAPFIAALDERVFERQGPPSDVSSFAILTAVVLLAVAVADVPAAGNVARAALDKHFRATASAPLFVTVTVTKTVPKVTTVFTAPPPSTTPVDTTPTTTTAAAPPATTLPTRTSASSPATTKTTMSTGSPTTTGTTQGDACSPLKSPVGAPAALNGLWVGDAATSGGGCEQLPENESTHPDVWFATGICAGNVRSVGIATRDQTVLLYGQLAQFVLSKATAGTLIDVSPRTSIRSGEVVVVSTDTGSYVALRQVVPAASSSGTPCDPPSDDGVYVVLVPGLVNWWLATTSPTDWLSPQLDTSSSPSGGYSFVGPDGTSVAHATCSDDNHCVIQYGGQSIPITATSPVRVGDILSRAP